MCTHTIAPALRRAPLPSYLGAARAAADERTAGTAAPGRAALRGASAAEPRCAAETEAMGEGAGAR
ncbi:hypothetical protein GCM10023324_40940 [Streptomyces youssoufiensis]